MSRSRHCSSSLSLTPARSIVTQSYLCYFNQGPTECRGPRSDVQGGITASMAGGSWLASLCSGFISDIFGRKKAIMYVGQYLNRLIRVGS